jgi:HEPN domain-containing protein
MLTLRVKTNEQVMAKISTILDTLSRKGDEIEIMDNAIYAYEKRYIDRALEDIREGRTYSIEDVE